MQKVVTMIILGAFLCSFFPSVYGNEIVLHPMAGVAVNLNPALDSSILKGIKIDKNNPFRFEFILDQGGGQGLSRVPKQIAKQEANKLIKYFLASLTIPEKDLWVNLSPYEKNRIVPDAFGQTEMGRDLLAQDYVLKQISASLMNPENELGKRFWKRVYEEAAKKFGTTNIPINTFNKVWIVPDKAIVYESTKGRSAEGENAHVATAYVVESKLKVMMEQDYVALNKSNKSATLPITSIERQQNLDPEKLTEVSSQIMREVIIPELTREINQGKNFANLRQVYNSLILAMWYKKKIKDSILAQVYNDKNKIAGVNINDPGEKQKIYEEYLKSFKKGVFNVIKDTDLPNGTSEPRKYFAGGVNMAMITQVLDLKDSSTEVFNEQASDLTVVDAAMNIISAKVRKVNRRTNEQRLKDMQAIYTRLEAGPATVPQLETDTGINRFYIYHDIDDPYFDAVRDKVIFTHEERDAQELQSDRQEILNVLSQGEYTIPELARARQRPIKQIEWDVEALRAEGNHEELLKNIKKGKLTRPEDEVKATPRILEDWIKQGVVSIADLQRRTGLERSIIENTIQRNASLKELRNQKMAEMGIERRDIHKREQIIKSLLDNDQGYRYGIDELAVISGLKERTLQQDIKSLGLTQHPNLIRASRTDHILTLHVQDSFLVFLNDIKDQYGKALFSRQQKADLLKMKPSSGKKMTWLRILTNQRTRLGRRLFNGYQIVKIMDIMSNSPGSVEMLEYFFRFRSNVGDYIFNPADIINILQAPNNFRKDVFEVMFRIAHELGISENEAVKWASQTDAYKTAFKKWLVMDAKDLEIRDRKLIYPLLDTVWRDVVDDVFDGGLDIKQIRKMVDVLFIASEKDTLEAERTAKQLRDADLWFSVRERSYLNTFSVLNELLFSSVTQIRKDAARKILEGIGRVDSQPSKASNRFLRLYLRDYPWFNLSDTFFNLSEEFKSVKSVWKEYLWFMSLDIRFKQIVIEINNIKQQYPLLNDDDIARLLVIKGFQRWEIATVQGFHFSLKEQDQGLRNIFLRAVRNNIVESDISQEMENITVIVNGISRHINIKNLWEGIVFVLNGWNDRNALPFLNNLDRGVKIPIDIDGHVHEVDVGNMKEYYLESGDVISIHLPTVSYNHAMLGSIERVKNGGIDLASAKLELSGDQIHFKLDPAQLSAFQDAAGFTPVILKTYPLTDLKQFLSI